MRHAVVGSIAVAVVTLAACASSSPGATVSTSQDAPGSSVTAATGSVVPSGFSSGAVRLTEPDGSTCERCLLLASTLEERRRGLMEVTSLGGYDGMAFLYDPPMLTSFWMKDTVMPLSSRFYDVDGNSLAAFDMDPCTADPCPTYGPGTELATVIEVAQGRLDELGFTDTARLELLLTPCDPA